MKFIEYARDESVQVSKIDRITGNVDGFAVIHIGIEQFKTSFPYKSFLSLLNIEDRDKVGDGPNPTSTAMAY